MESTYNVHKLVSDYPGFRQPCDALGLTGTDGLRAVISESDIKQRLVALLGVAFLTFTSREAKAQAVRVRRAALRVVHLGEPRPAPEPDVTFEVHAGRAEVLGWTQLGTFNLAHILIEFGRAIDFETERLLTTAGTSGRILVTVAGQPREFSRRNTASNALAHLSYHHRDEKRHYTNPYVASFNALALAIVLHLDFRVILADMAMRAIDDGPMCRLLSMLAVRLGPVLAHRDALEDYAREVYSFSRTPGQERGNLDQVNRLACYLADTLQLRKSP